MAAGVEPQSSWIFRPQTPDSICSSSGWSTEQLPLPSSPTFTGMPSNDWSIRSVFQRPDVIVVPLLPSVGPMPPPKTVVMPLLRQA